MLKLKIKAPRFMWDGRKFHQALRDKLNFEVKEAAREFVRAAVVNIPVDTGEARGTFLPIGRFLNVPIPIPNAHPLANKSATTGAEANKQLIFTFPSNQYGVYFQIDWQLFHFWFNDFFAHSYPNGQMPTPWKSIEAGRDAFLKYMRTEAVLKLPKLKDFLFVTYFNTSDGKFE